MSSEPLAAPALIKPSAWRRWDCALQRAPRAAAQRRAVLLPRPTHSTQKYLLKTLTCAE